MRANEQVVKNVTEGIVVNIPRTESLAMNSINYEIDVLSQFRANVQKLEELHGRMQFVLGEINTLIAKRK